MTEMERWAAAVVQHSDGRWTVEVPAGDQCRRRATLVDEGGGRALHARKIGHRIRSHARERGRFRQIGGDQRRQWQELPPKRLDAIDGQQRGARAWSLSID